MQERVIPLVICSDAGMFLGLVMSNEKGWKKSQERNEVWALHSDSGTLLPEKKWGKILKLVLHEGWCHVTVSGTPSQLPPSALPQKDALSAQGSGLEFLIDCIHQRKEIPREGSYTRYLFSEGGEKIRKKLAEEAIEVVLAKGEQICAEAADLLYHFLVFLEHEDVSFPSIVEELQRRMNTNS